MDQKPLISVLTPVFNCRPYIEQTMRSLLSQTYRNWEWIVLDDGSTDGTGDVVQGAGDRRIRYAFQEHAGMDRLAGTHNKALMMCRGELVAMLDGDDYWPEYKLEVQAEDFGDPYTVLSYGECWVINHRGKKTGYMSIPRDTGIASNDPQPSALKGLLFEKHNFLPNSTVVLRGSALRAIGGFVDERGLPQDFPTWVKLSLTGRFAAHHRCLGFWRRHPSSTHLRRPPELLFERTLEFSRNFLLENAGRLSDLSFTYNMPRVEDHWKEVKGRYTDSLPHFRAAVLTGLGLFAEARNEFKRFPSRNLALANKLLYCLIILSALTRVDLVSPVAILKGKIDSLRSKLARRL